MYFVISTPNTNNAEIIKKVIIHVYILGCNSYSLREPSSTGSRYSGGVLYGVFFLPILISRKIFTSGTVIVSLVKSLKIGVPIFLRSYTLILDWNSVYPQYPPIAVLANCFFACL